MPISTCVGCENVRPLDSDGYCEQCTALNAEAETRGYEATEKPDPFVSIAAQYEDPTTRNIQIGIERARQMLGLDDE